MAGMGFQMEELEHKTHVLYCPGCKLTYKLLHRVDSGTDCVVCREHGGAEKPKKKEGSPIRSYSTGPFSRYASRGIPLSRELPEPTGRVYPPPPCSGSTCPREVIVPPICPPMAPCDRGGAAKVCPIVKPKRVSAEGGIGAIPVLHELTQQNPDHLEGPVFLAEKLMFCKQDFEDACEPIEVACETTSIHWPLNYTEGSQTEPIDVYPLPGCIEPVGCVTEMLEPSEACFDPSLNSVPLGHILTMEECVSPTCDLIEVARECTSIHRPPWTDSTAQTDPVRTVPRPISTECQEVVTGIERESVDATHDRVIVHSERVCFESDPTCERLLSRDGEVILRPPQEVARVPLPDRIIIEEHVPSDESQQQLQQDVSLSQQSGSAGARNTNQSTSGERSQGRSGSAKGSAKPGRSKNASRTSSSASVGRKGGK